MSGFTGDASEFRQLAVEFNAAAHATLPAARAVIQDGAAQVKEAWQTNARATSGLHGKHYPNSITYETRMLAGSAVGEIGPDVSKLQGGMGRGFEFGSRNQPPHLDGTKAVDASEGGITSALTSAFDDVVP